MYVSVCMYVLCMYFLTHTSNTLATLLQYVWAATEQETNAFLDNEMRKARLQDRIDRAEVRLFLCCVCECAVLCMNVWSCVVCACYV